MDEIGRKKGVVGPNFHPIPYFRILLGLVEKVWIPKSYMDSQFPHMGPT